MKTIKKKALITLISITTLTIGMEASAAQKCKDKEPPKQEVGKKCKGLNTDDSTEGNPFIYVNPEVACDLGLELPGLPSFGFDGNLDMCSLAQAVTGPMIDELNQSMEDAMDSALAEVGLTMDNQLMLDLNDIAENELDRWQQEQEQKQALEEMNNQLEASYINEKGQDLRLRGTDGCGSVAFDKGLCGWNDDAERSTDGSGTVIRWDEIDWSTF